MLDSIRERAWGSTLYVKNLLVEKQVPKDLIPTFAKLKDVQRTAFESNNRYLLENKYPANISQNDYNKSMHGAFVREHDQNFIGEKSLCKLSENFKLQDVLNLQFFPKAYHILMFPSSSPSSENNWLQLPRNERFTLVKEGFLKTNKELENYLLSFQKIYNNHINLNNVDLSAR